MPHPFPITRIWADLIRTKYVDEIDFYAKCFAERVLPAFSRIAEEADEVEQKSWERRCEYATEDSDPAAIAEQARDEAVNFLMMMRDLQQGLVNVFGTGLYHLVEQQLLHFFRCGVLDPGEELQIIAAGKAKQVFTLAELADRLRTRGISMCELPSWQIVDDLRLFANSVKHADGPACEKLRQRRPELFTPTWETESDMAWPVRASVYQPLFGEGLYLAPREFDCFVGAAKKFWGELADEIVRVSPP